MKSNDNRPQGESRRVLKLLWIRRQADDGKKSSITPTREDAYFLGWVSVSMLTTFDLFMLIGVAALGLAVIAVVFARWKLTHATGRLPERMWWYCWIALTLFAIGLAIYDAHVPQSKRPRLAQDAHFPLTIFRTGVA